MGGFVTKYNIGEKLCRLAFLDPMHLDPSFSDFVVGLIHVRAGGDVVYQASVNGSFYRENELFRSQAEALAHLRIMEHQRHTTMLSTLDALAEGKVD